MASSCRSSRAPRQTTSRFALLSARQARLKCTAVPILTRETNAISPDAATRQKASDWLEERDRDQPRALRIGDGVRLYHSAIGEFSAVVATTDEKETAAAMCFRAR